MEDRKSRRSKNQSSRSSYSFAGGSCEFSRSLLLPPPFSTVALLVTALFLLPVQSISFLYRLLHQTPSLVIHQLGFRIETKRRIGMRKRCGLVGFFFKKTLTNEKLTRCNLDMVPKILSIFTLFDLIFSI